MNKLDKQRSSNHKAEQHGDTKIDGVDDTMAGTFIGVGVGPGPMGFITVSALSALQNVDVIMVPKGKTSGESIARHCLRELDIAESKLQEVVYNMDSDKSVLREHYTGLAVQIAEELRRGVSVAYLTLGDALTYSTYSYTLQSLISIYPEVQHYTFPGITSYAALASATAWPIGQGKERTLILPCPDDKVALRHDIETHDIVILMKIGKRLPMVLDVLQEMRIASHCAFASKLGLPGEFVCSNVEQMQPGDAGGYFATMLIRKEEPIFQSSEN
ncbi:MAG: precorrin-2 C(20)-methyltransferase [Candidatus Obscuribacterales bacterium]|nr:precorrin-2 C(20)-methyltransferase [Candidatus Obscuribacterales bacterium]